MGLCSFNLFWWLVTALDRSWLGIPRWLSLQHYIRKSSRKFPSWRARKSWKWVVWRNASNLQGHGIPWHPNRRGSEPRLHRVTSCHRQTLDCQRWLPSCRLPQAHQEGNGCQKGSYYITMIIFKLTHSLSIYNLNESGFVSKIKPSLISLRI